MKKKLIFLTLIAATSLFSFACGNSASSSQDAGKAEEIATTEAIEVEESAVGEISQTINPSLNLEFPKSKKYQTATAADYDEYAFFNYKESADIITSYEDQLCLQKSYGHSRASYENVSPDEFIPGVSELSFFEYSVEETQYLVILHFKYKNLDDPKNCNQLNDKGIITYDNPNMKNSCFKASSTFKNMEANGYKEVNAVLYPAAR